MLIDCLIVQGRYTMKQKAYRAFTPVARHYEKYAL